MVLIIRTATFCVPRLINYDSFSSLKFFIIVYFIKWLLEGHFHCQHMFLFSPCSFDVVTLVMEYLVPQCIILFWIRLRQLDCKAEFIIDKSAQIKINLVTVLQVSFKMVYQLNEISAGIVLLTKSESLSQQLLVSLICLSGTPFSFLFASFLRTMRSQLSRLLCYAESSTFYLTQFFLTRRTKKDPLCFWKVRLMTRNQPRNCGTAFVI